VARDYAKIRSRYWTGETGKKLRKAGPQAQLLGAYLMSCGSSNMIGLYYLPLALIAHEVAGLTIEGASEALRTLSEVGFAHYDADEEIVFVPHMAFEQIAEELKPGDNQIKGVISALQEYRKSRFFWDFVEIYREPFHLPEELANRRPSEGPAKPLRSQDQEQDQEQDPPSRAIPGASTPEQEPTETATATSDQPAKVRPTTAHNLIHCLKVAMERARPERGPYHPGSFCDRDAGELLRSLQSSGKDQTEEIERRLALFVADDGMSPWTVLKFCRSYNGLGAARASPLPRVRGGIPADYTPDF
jgi:hypothetical protein